MKPVTCIAPRVCMDIIVLVNGYGQRSLYMIQRGAYTGIPNTFPVYTCCVYYVTSNINEYAYNLHRLTLGDDLEQKGYTVY